jgi:hypothetical protein
MHQLCGRLQSLTNEFVTCSLLNQFPSPPKNNWLMNPVAKMWSYWLPSDALQTVQYVFSTRDS